MAKKIPLRQCVGCREQKAKKDLLRVLRTPEDQVVIDGSGKKNGRGAYLCPSGDCLQKARKSRALARALKKEIPDEIYQSLEEELNSYGGK